VSWILVFLPYLID